MEKMKSVYVCSPDEIPNVEHWAIISGSSVHHAAEGVWAPGHGYPAHSENIIRYQAYFDEKEFLQALEQEFGRAFGSGAIGIHVDKLYTKKTVVKVIETNLGS